MGLFDKFKKKSNSLTIEEIIFENYNQKYFDECKYIWKNYVPKRGQATNLQGELLREIEKIRCEAQDRVKGIIRTVFFIDGFPFTLR